MFQCLNLLPYLTAGQIVELPLLLAGRRVNRAPYEGLWLKVLGSHGVGTFRLHQPRTAQVSP